MTCEALHHQLHPNNGRAHAQQHRPLGTGGHRGQLARRRAARASQARPPHAPAPRGADLRSNSASDPSRAHAVGNGRVPAARCRCSPLTLVRACRRCRGTREACDPVAMPARLLTSRPSRQSLGCTRNMAASVRATHSATVGTPGTRSRTPRAIAAATGVAGGPPRRSRRARQRTGLLPRVLASKRVWGQGGTAGCGVGLAIDQRIRRARSQVMRPFWLRRASAAPPVPDDPCAKTRVTLRCCRAPRNSCLALTGNTSPATVHRSGLYQLESRTPVAVARAR